MQSDYMPLGWLGIIIGSKIYYKFDIDLRFEQTFASMLKEINSYALVNDLTSFNKTAFSSLNNNKKGLNL